MSETQRYKVKPANRAIRIDALRDFQKPMVAWWYCGFSAPDKDSHQPKVKVEFRELNDDYTVKPSYTHKNILVSLLGHVTLGSIWQQGFCSWEIQFQNRTCTIPFPVGGWQTIRSADVPGGLFPPSLHRNYPGDLNWLLSLQTHQGNQLYIPAEEYFTRCYGASQEVRRVLATYNFAEVVHERLYAPPDPEQEKECDPGIWPIRLRQKMTKADAVMLAYAKYTEHGYRTLASVHNQLRHQFTNMTRKAMPAFIKIIPWHQENFRLTVTGLPFNDGQSFLALRITGASSPRCMGNIIELSMDIGNDYELPADADSKTAFDGALISTHIIPPDVVNVTDDQNPDISIQKVIIETPGLTLIGDPSPVRDKVNRQAEYRSGKKRKGENAGGFSSGHPEKNDSDVGEFKSETPLIIDTQGILRDMLAACRELMRVCPHQFKAVEWFTFENGFSSEEEPGFISLIPLNDESKEAKWCYVGSGHDRRLRYALIIRLQTIWGDVYIAEIERDLVRVKDAQGDDARREKNGRGMVFSFKQGGSPSAMIKAYLSQIRYACGIVN
ncbi:hypothetical protein SME10J_41050 [Serratia marcescens]|nr:hypothetical protein SME10J_41050 [Serratia marcescens]